VKERIDRAEEDANRRADAIVKQNADELHDVRAKCDDASARLAASAALLEQRGVNPISLKPFDERAADEQATRQRELAEFVARLGELDEILRAREEALLRKTALMSSICAKLEQMPVDVPLLTV
jgi:hypothetical protein